MLNIGSQIPHFELSAFYQDDLTTISLNDFSDKWLILLFYPADFTFVCPTELEQAAQMEKEFTKLNAQIISISTDTHFVHKAWHDNSKAISKIKYPMAADPTGEFCRTYNTYNPAEGLSFRATYIIDPDQKIISYDVHDNSIGRDMNEVLRKLQAAHFVRENDGVLVCPASWKPGDKTLTPGKDLVGKI